MRYDVRMEAVFVPYTEPGSDVSYYVYSDKPYLRGEDYPALVEVWNNQDTLKPLTFREAIIELAKEE